MVLFPGEMTPMKHTGSQIWALVSHYIGLWVGKSRSKEVGLAEEQCLIEAGEKYQIVSTTEQLEILNFFVPQPNIC